MSRPLRIEFAGALYHVTSRGDQRAAIYRDDDDRRAWLRAMGLVAERFNFSIPAFCQMSNHYHLLVETAEGNLSQGMRQLNARYSQYFNWRHDLAGHVFQGRYKAILVQREQYLLELIRYIVLNPVRAGMVRSAAEWPWSSHRYTLGKLPAPGWLNLDWLLNCFGEDRTEALARYIRFVEGGVGAPSPLKAVAHQLLLGDAAFVELGRKPAGPVQMKAVPMIQRRAKALTLVEYSAQCASRGDAMAQAFLSTAYTMTQIAEFFGVSCKTVSRAVHKYEQDHRMAGAVSECQH
jgi:putative transposase